MKTNTTSPEQRSNPFIETHTGNYPTLLVSSSQESSTSSTCLAQDPFHDHDADHPDTTLEHQAIALSEAFGDEHIHYVQVAIS
jgi:hypothetical protein